jgi:integrase
MQGRYVHKLCNALDHDEALRERGRFLNKFRRDHVGILPRWTVERAVDHWLELREKVSQSSRTLKKDRYVMGVLKREFGDCQLREFTAASIEQYQARRVSEVNPGTVNREIRYLAILLKKAHLWNALRDDYKPLKMRVDVQARALTAEQAQHLLTVAKANARWNIVGWCAALALNTGLRGGELKKLTLGKIEATPPALWVGRSTTKTDAGARRVPLNPMAWEATERLRERAKGLGATAPEHFILPENMTRHTAAADPLRGTVGYDPDRSQVTLRTAWDNLCAEAGRQWKPEHDCDPFTDLRFHDLRHTFITQCGMAGVPIERLMAIVGHVSMAMTRYYMHLFDAATRSVVDKVQERMQAPCTSYVPQLRDSSESAQLSAF